MRYFLDSALPSIALFIGISGLLQLAIVGGKLDFEAVGHLKQAPTISVIKL
ncbi:MAG TPA: hypothetical protein VNI84_01220 [Pyrinomonadaceae bacterium]|nr:hypothetical protein [Pyrinomonadaceae bacterium]